MYRFNWIHFGIKCSPSLLGATLNHHLKGCQNSVATDIKENIYVDNVIPGENIVKEVVDFHKEAKQIFKKSFHELMRLDVQ